MRGRLGSRHDALVALATNPEYLGEALELLLGEQNLAACLIRWLLDDPGQNQVMNAMGCQAEVEGNFLDRIQALHGFVSKSAGKQGFTVNRVSLCGG